MEVLLHHVMVPVQKIAAVLTGEPVKDGNVFRQQVTHVEGALLEIEVLRGDAFRDTSDEGIHADDLHLFLVQKKDSRVAL
ncbi:hypothetical protein BBJ29_000268 [Phytophthora kernoviae]|uniref:Uncharacterized protein n=1 Tax=Phytophthora kernoviae TaxID=325452 RepID=A0A3F2S155_9STRA|nr:hypothetical protein BBJ29_000268 [Phytophthora kernoviae]RLN67718.1 hypothetical protein BBP00_00001471 [Phytophthora kernoviae]